MATQAKKAVPAKKAPAKKAVPVKVPKRPPVKAKISPQQKASLAQAEAVKSISAAGMAALLKPFDPEEPRA